MQTGELLGILVANDLVKLEETAEEILRASNEEVAEGEDTPLVDSGNAAKVRLHRSCGENVLVERHGLSEFFSESPSTAFILVRWNLAGDWGAHAFLDEQR